MISEICAGIKNYFTYPCDRHIGDWTIQGGIITPALDIPTDYIRIVGSRLNDGVHKRTNGSFNLTDESFHGGIWIMSPPADFLTLCAEIDAWQAENGGKIAGPFASESFGGYSYSLKSSANGGGAYTWADAFGTRLARYRRIREL